MSGRTLEAIRADLIARLANEQERYDLLARDALALCDPGMLEQGSTQRVYIEGAAQMAAAHEFTDQAQLREVLVAIEEKHRLIALLAGCIDTPDPVHVQIGVKGIDPAGEHLALISAPYSYQDQSQGTVGVLGPMRMHYERAITAVAFVARASAKHWIGVSKRGGTQTRGRKICLLIDDRGEERNSSRLPADADLPPIRQREAKRPSLRNFTKLRAEKEDLLQTLVRRQADFENFRKSTERDRHEEGRRGVERLILDLIPVLDAFDRALQAHEDPAYEEYRKGVTLIRKQLWDALARHGVQRVDAAGKMFDPHVHQAIERVESSEYPDGFIVDVFQDGYMFHGRVLRPAIVRVAVHPDEGEDSRHK